MIFCFFFGFYVSVWTFLLAFKPRESCTCEYNVETKCHWKCYCFFFCFCCSDEKIDRKIFFDFGILPQPIKNVILVSIVLIEDFYFYGDNKKYRYHQHLALNRNKFVFGPIRASNDIERFNQSSTLCTGHSNEIHKHRNSFVQYK